MSDGDFHNAPDPGSWETYYKGQGFASDWRVTQRSTDVYGAVVNKFPNGVCSIDLDGAAVGAIEHAGMRTKPQTNYTVTFLFSGNDGGPPSVKAMKVEAAGQSQILQWDDSNGGPEHGDYDSETWTFTARSGRTSLRFTSLDTPKSNAHGPVVAAISVTESLPAP